MMDRVFGNKIIAPNKLLITKFHNSYKTAEYACAQL